MLNSRQLWLVTGLGVALLFGPIRSSPAADRQFLYGHVPSAVARYNLQPTGQLPATKSLHLAIGLPLRNQGALTDLLQQLYDPASPNYHQFLTPEQFAAQFGPTEQDYQKVIAFAKRNGLTVTGTSVNRLLLDVSGSVADVEKAFQVTLRTYRHPTENREFYAPDTEPSVDAALSVADIQGLSDYSRPRPKLHRMNAAMFANAAPRQGSAPDNSGSYFGNDFRNAYAPNVTLTGAGQMVGLFEADGYYASDIAAYAAAAGNGRTNIVIQTVLLDGYNGTPTTSGNGEVSLDIEMAMAMAPGLAKIVVFEGNPNNYVPNDILNAMAASNTLKNLSCSWGWSGGPSNTTDAIFQNMATEGQSFFNASGDSDAFTTGASSVNGVDNVNLYNAPSSSPYITQVGGTTLTMNGTGASYASETVWNWGYDANAGGYVGSSGGISSYYSLPSWQTNVNNMTSRGGSTKNRNIPDVALTANNVFVYEGNGSSADYGGTSCAAPLWAGFVALVNQQATASGKSSVGFINPAVYAIAARTNYASCFHDITTGSNTWPSSSKLFYATNGYDLCTGLGTPAGQSLINALAPLDSLVITPASGFAASGFVGGPFSVTTQNFLLTNSSASSLNWTLGNTSLWLNVSPVSGTLASGSQTTVAASLNSVASNLTVGTYSASVWFTNLTSGGAQGRQFTLQILQSLAVSPTSGFTSSGQVGGSFSVTNQNFSLTNLGASSLNWSAYSTASWLTASPNSGTLTAGGQTTLTVSLNSAANSLAAGTNTANVVITNQNGGAVVLPFILLIGQTLIQNGGFEAGTFTNWTLSGNTNYYVSVTSGDSTYVHSGTYGAQLGPESSLGYLSQTLPTVAGQKYLLSLWLDSPSISGTATPNEFSVSWNGSVIFDQSNIGKIGWTNLQFIVTATSSSTVLQLGFRDDPYYLGLDDINVWPIPNPSFRSVAKTSTNAVLFSWYSLAGIAYQVQYSTNLTKTNWIILSTNTATGSTLTFTNFYGTNRQRFYRIRELP